jgi:hypothetical protein
MKSPIAFNLKKNSIVAELGQGLGQLFQENL